MTSKSGGEMSAEARVSYLRARLAEARKAYKSLAEKLKGQEAELAFMNGEYVKLTGKYAEAVNRAASAAALEVAARAVEDENKKLKRDVENGALDLKNEQEFTKAQEKARDEWKAFALGLVVQLIAIDSVVKDAGGDEPAAVRQLVLGAKKIPHPQADPVHPNIWKWAILSPALMVGAAAYFLYKGLGGPAGAAK